MTDLLALAKNALRRIGYDEHARDADGRPETTEHPSSTESPVSVPPGANNDLNVLSDEDDDPDVWTPEALDALRRIVEWNAGVDRRHAEKGKRR